MTRLYAALLVFGALPICHAAAQDPQIERSVASQPMRLAEAGSGEASEISAKEAFEAAKELGTIDAWNAFLASFPNGFYADLARAYVTKLGGAAAPHEAKRARPPAPPRETAAPAEAPAAREEPAPRQEAAPQDEPAPPQRPAAQAEPQPVEPTAPRESSPPPRAAATTARPVPVVESGVPATDPSKPAVMRGGRYMGFPEKFNRYYTDRSWKPSKIVYVSPDGGGDGAGRGSPTSVKQAIDAAGPGTEIVFLPGAYKGCFEFSKENGGTYDNPVVLYGERNPDQSIGVSMTCCKTGRQTCFNIEQADYVAVDGFSFTGGRYGVRVVGAGYPASEHSSGVAVMNCRGQDQDNDPFFTGQSDWAVFERNVGSGAKKGDGHGIYLSNGSDWNVVRFNETFGNDSSDFQINADPASTCQDVGIPFNDPRCDAYAGEGEGGQGASDYFLVDSNFFHHSLGPGANFASVRRSLVRNNVFGLHRDRHNVSFYNESDNPKLGSSENRIVHNLFVTTDRHGVKFDNNSVGNLFENNLVIGVRTAGGKATANPSALLMEVDEAGATNTFRANLYVGGKLEGREPNDQEAYEPSFSPGWFRNFPTALNHDPNDFAPTRAAPFLGIGARLPDAPTDLNGTTRPDQTTIGPIEPR